MLLKTSNETALCNGMMMVVDDLVTGDGGGDEGVVCFVEDSSSCDSWYRMAVGFCFLLPPFLICKIEEIVCFV